MNDDDNPQLIFESLNSTGLDLSEGDKIRNFILMGLPAKEQEEYYDKYWNRIEECTKYDVSSFIRDYLSIKQMTIPAQRKIYINFKEYVEMSSLEAEALLKELLDYAKRYKILLDGGTKSKTLNACIYSLNRLETTVHLVEGISFALVIKTWNSQQISLMNEEQVIALNELLKNTLDKQEKKAFPKTLLWNFFCVLSAVWDLCPGSVFSYRIRVYYR